jgi:hypothetical protein
MKYHQIDRDLFMKKFMAQMKPKSVAVLTLMIYIQ